MNTKYIYRWTPDEDYSKPNNNYNEETDYIITDGIYDFSDWLQSYDVRFEEEDGTYYVLDENGDRTGEAYWIINVEETDEDLVG